MGKLLYSEDNLYRLRRTKDQVLNLEEHYVLFAHSEKSSGIGRAIIY